MQKRRDCRHTFSCQSADNQCVQSLSFIVLVGYLVTKTHLLDLHQVNWKVGDRIMDKQLTLFKKWLHNNTLVHVEIVYRKVGRKGVFGRFISIDEAKGLVVFYDVDQKQVLSFMLNEIDSISPSADHTDLSELASH